MLRPPGTVIPRRDGASTGPRGPMTVMSATAGPGSGLTSSITEVCRAAAPRAVNHWSDSGGRHDDAAGPSACREATSPGAIASVPRTVTGPARSAVAGRSAGTSTVVVVTAPDWDSSTSPARPVALATRTSRRSPMLLGQVRMARLSSVSRGGWAVSTGGRPHEGQGPDREGRQHDGEHCGQVQPRPASDALGWRQCRRRRPDARCRRHDSPPRRARCVGTHSTRTSTTPRPEHQQHDPQPRCGPSRACSSTGRLDLPGPRGAVLGTGLVEAAGGVEPRGHGAVGRCGQHDVLDARVGRAAPTTAARGREVSSWTSASNSVVLASAARISSSPRVTPSPRRTAYVRPSSTLPRMTRMPWAGRQRVLHHVRRDAGVAVVGSSPRPLEHEPAQPERRDDGGDRGQHAGTRRRRACRRGGRGSPARGWR